MEDTPKKDDTLNSAKPLYLVLEGQFILWEESSSLTIIVPGHNQHDASGHVPPLVCAYGGLKPFPLARGKYECGGFTGVSNNMTAIQAQVLVTGTLGTAKFFKKSRRELFAQTASSPSLPAIAQRAYLTITFPGRPTHIYGWNCEKFGTASGMLRYATTIILKYDDSNAFSIAKIDSQFSWAPSLIPADGVYVVSLTLIPLLLQDEHHEHATAVLQNIEDLLAVKPYALDITLHNPDHNFAPNDDFNSRILFPKKLLDLLAVTAKSEGLKWNYPVDDCRVPPLWLEE